MDFYAAHGAASAATSTPLRPAVTSRAAAYGSSSRKCCAKYLFQRRRLMPPLEPKLSSACAAVSQGRRNGSADSRSRYKAERNARRAAGFFRAADRAIAYFSFAKKAVETRQIFKVEMTLCSSTSARLLTIMQMLVFWHRRSVVGRLIRFSCSATSFWRHTQLIYFIHV